MTSTARHLYEFGPYRVDVAEGLLLRDGKPVDITAKVFDLLVLMVENQGKLLEKNYLLEALWPDSFVEEVNLSVNMSALRKALGENASDPQYIETVPKRGYRFIGSVTTRIAADGEPAAEAAHGTSPALIPGPQSNVGAGAAVADLTLKRPAQSPIESVLRPGLLIPISLTAVVVLLVAAYLLWRGGRPNGEAVATRSRTIAVLPFKTLTTNDADQALGLGMADALITRLGNLQQIIVRPTSTVLKYSDAGKDPLAAGRELGVETVLDGRLQRDDKKIRVTAQLLRVQDGSSLWAGKFDDFFTNLFALQDSISEKMAEALSMRLTRDEQQLMAKRNTENTEAYQLYVEGRYLHFKYQFEKAVGFFQGAIEKDPDYSLAYTGMAMNYVALATRMPNRQEMRDKAMEAATRALSLDPNLDEAHNAMGWVKFLGDWDWSGAEPSLRRATELNPNNADAHINYAALLTMLGRFDEALRESERAFQLDPVSGDVNLNYAFNLFFARRYDQALDRANRMAELDEHHPSLGIVLADLYVAKSMFEQAINEVEKRYGADERKRNPFLAIAYARLGRRAQAESVLQTMIRNADRRGSNYSIAAVYAALGDRERALDWLDKAYRARDNQMIHLKVDPAWDSLRDDPRFATLLGRMGL